MSIAQPDLQRLRTIADYRVLTVRQLATLEARPPKAVHRSLASLIPQGLLAETTRENAARRGRPEKLISVTSAGFAALSESDALPPEIREPDVTLAGLPHIEHQLLLNRVRIEWMRLDRVCPALRSRFVPHSSPIAGYDAADTDAVPGLVPTVIRLDDRRTFRPDAVATISDVERHRTVLFFLEIDRGTEPRETHGKPRSTIDRKIEDYQRYRRSGGYRDYAAFWKCELHGFRVLFVTQTVNRLKSLCRLLGRVRPREFVWLTDQHQLLDRGIGALIWARGGQLDQPGTSILGSRAPQGGGPLTATSDAVDSAD